MGAGAVFKGLLKGKAKKTKPKPVPYKRENIKENEPLRQELMKKKVRTVEPTKKEMEKMGVVKGDTKGASAAAFTRIDVDKYKGAQAGLVKSYNNKVKEYNKLSTKDKKGERGQLLQNALRDMKKKITGKKPIKTQEQAGLMPKDMAQGGLKMPTVNQVGLKKLPTQVRNKMGYMYGGGMAKKPKMGNMDYRKGGLLLVAINMMKKGKKGK
tara:strand:- start:299 stop:931 length:633 start_codon:yes stop_codon:yes gene_type:complete